MIVLNVFSLNVLILFYFILFDFIKIRFHSFFFYLFNLDFSALQMTGSSTAPTTDAPPSSNERKKCYIARDNYYHCAAMKGKEAEECLELRKIYQSSCLDSWVNLDIHVWFLYLIYTYLLFLSLSHTHIHI